MNANVGGIDRVLRILVGIALIVWALMGGPVWAWVGIVPLATGLLKFCPFYPLLGLSTCQK
jgi:hypothetical protein